MAGASRPGRRAGPGAISPAPPSVSVACHAINKNPAPIASLPHHWLAIRSPPTDPPSGRRRDAGTRPRCLRPPTYSPPQMSAHAPAHGPSQGASAGHWQPPCRERIRMEYPPQRHNRRRGEGDAVAPINVRPTAILIPWQHESASCVHGSGSRGPASRPAIHGSQEPPPIPATSEFTLPHRVLPSIGLFPRFPEFGSAPTWRARPVVRSLAAR